jgi:isoleucyl-tRNA synthetase
VKEAAGTYETGKVEEWVRTFWKDQEIYRKVRALRSGGTPLFFVDGPPYTTGNIHLGTAWNKILKDSILRYHRLKGRHIIERAGYDMHGLPIEVKVEHELGFTSKKDIEEYGIGRFIDECRAFAQKNMVVMSEQFLSLGVWLDFDRPYLTISEDYIEAAWWTLRRAEEEGMLEQGHRVVNWCPRCETAIADSEVEYWDATDPSLFVKFPVRGKEGEYLVIWTTTPWTLPANVAAAVHPQVIYAKVRAKKDGVEETLWIADDLLDLVLRKGRYRDFTVLDKRLGSDLVGMEYLSPLAEKVPFQAEHHHRVVEADFVTVENTGIVHIAPGHGWDDYLLGIREHLPVFCPVDAAGRFTEEGGCYQGMHVRDANEVVLTDLGSSLLSRGEVTHRYGHCWRCKTPIIYRATEQWFLKASELRDAMLDEIKGVTWYPEWAGSARFHDWLKEARDWCISRQRYWGIPIPIWKCRSCGAQKVVGTIAELEDLSGTKVPDPHRPWVDGITLPCPCGGTMRRVEDIFDVWFDSAVASWGTLGFPRRREEFDAHWPADFITEGQDQTRGWFYSQLGASTIAFHRAPYRSVLMHGFALDADGRKMSKSLGNVVAPEEVIRDYGVDILRLYILSANAPWDDLKFNWEGVKTVQRALSILWNVYRFPLPYMILDEYTPATGPAGYDPAPIRGRVRDLAAEDRWILSRATSLAREVDAAMAGCQLHRATRAVQEFVLQDLSRWYIQLVRNRLWLEGKAREKQDAYDTLYHVLRRLIQLLSPFTPHLAEYLYQNLKTAGDPLSVHMLDWPAGDDVLRDPSLESAMEVVRAFDDAVANARQAGKRKLRWPVGEVVVATSSPKVVEAIGMLQAICRARANSRKVLVVEGAWDRIGRQAEPVMKKVGPAFGKDAPKVRELVMAADADRLQREIAKDGKAVLEAGGKRYELTGEMLMFHEKVPEGIFAAAMPDGTVYVDVSLTTELEAEGYAREVIRRLQEMRRQADLAVEDFIVARVEVGDSRVADLLRGTWESVIRDEVRARELVLSVPGGSSPEGPWTAEAEWDVEGITLRTAISRAPRR